VEISVVMSPLNLSSMLVAGDGSFAVMQQTRGLRNIQLLGQMGDYYPWYCSHFLSGRLIPRAVRSKKQHDLQS
jgi:hypothetical protein